MKFLRRLVNRDISLPKSQPHVTLEFLLLQRLSSLQIPDEYIMNFISRNNLFGDLPIARSIKHFDVSLARALFLVPAPPLRFVPRPAQHGRQSGQRRDARVSGVTAADRFGYHPIRRSLQ